MLLELTAACLLLVYEGTVGSRRAGPAQSLDAGAIDISLSVCLSVDWGHAERGAEQRLEEGLKLHGGNERLETDPGAGNALPATSPMHDLQ